MTTLEYRPLYPVPFGDLFETLELDDVPSTEKWCFKPLFKTSASGSLLRWQVGFVQSSETEGQLLVYYGFNNSTQRRVSTEVEHPDLVNHALVLTRARARDKIKAGYSFELGSPSSDRILPMLAVNWTPGKHLRDSLAYPVAVQPKLDGHRLMSRIHMDEVECYTRGNITYPPEHLAEIREELKILFEFLPTGWYVDGELYDPGQRFQGITSAIRKVKKESELLKTITYNIFDVVDPELKKPFEQRYPVYTKAIDEYQKRTSNVKLKAVPVYLVDSEEEILEKHDEFMGQGFEGIIIRRLGQDPRKPLRKLTAKEQKNSCYLTRRGVNMYKYKGGAVDFEAEIIGGFSGSGTEEGAVVYQLRDVEGREFNARPRGTIEKRRWILEHIEEYIGKMATVRVPKDGFTDAGLPRFPVVIGVL